MDTASDLDLWTRAQRGDPQAFGDLFHRHATAVYTHVFRRTASWERAEDAVSVVFLETWRLRSTVTLDDRGTLLPWLLGVANNVVRRQYRTRLRHARLLAKLPRPEDVGDHADLVDQRLEDQQRMRRTLDAMSSLSVGEQEVLALCVWAELTYEQAAVAMSIPVGTVRSRLSRARAKLKTTLDHTAPATAAEEESP